MLKPRALKKGDRVAVLAPASPFERPVFEAGVAELGSLGFEPVVDESVFARRGYLAGTASARASALREAWRAPDIAGIFTARGGYGSAQLLPLLDRAETVNARKPFVGCSDLTSVLVYLGACCQMVSFHGPMMVNLGTGDDGYDRASLMAAVAGTSPVGELCPEGVEALSGGESSGVLLGGTLTQLVASLGTPYAFSPPDGHVLLLDDVGEKPYRIDRMLTQVRQAGWLARASAVVCAEFPDCHDNDGGDARSVVAELLSDFPGPVLFGFPTGHTSGPAFTLPLGVTATVTTTPRPRLIIDEAAVE